jgi:hypothetical protein
MISLVRFSTLGFFYNKHHDHWPLINAIKIFKNFVSNLFRYPIINRICTIYSKAGDPFLGLLITKIAYERYFARLLL